MPTSPIEKQFDAVSDLPLPAGRRNDDPQRFSACHPKPR